ncbi:glycosyltransferase [Saccharolobus islandicus]|uniref:Glycosyl transferase family 2 n=2 Tax=Saccharolobus islandicus TaxID=43080 RepID=C4KES6_SACI6|nr:glycosyltransferase [Sulfolobus islandicus]ACP54599.1 glycosyl transferase family 2 [Sulfolobus islandicus M.16.27]ACR41273.1 glycosyl transferase family 2 [Sulfolobus islandicus M.16.4]
MNEPLVSIVIPTLNSEKTVKGTLESLQILDYKNFEVVVVDGYSTDNTLNIVKQFVEKYGIRIVLEERKGRGVAYNRGVLESRGKYVAFLDSDARIATPTWIKNAVILMENNDKIGVVFTKVFSPPDSKFLQKSIDTYLCKGFTTANGAIYRKDAVLKVGGFNEKMNYMQEDELLYKLTKAGYKYEVNFNDKIYHYHRDSIRSYIKQNMEAAYGAKIFHKLTKEKWVIRDALTRLTIFFASIIFGLSLILLNIKLFLILLLLSYIILLLKVNFETCKHYRWSKYIYLSPFLIYISIIGYSIGFLTQRDKKR